MLDNFSTNHSHLCGSQANRIAVLVGQWIHIFMHNTVDMTQNQIEPSFF